MFISYMGKGNQSMFTGIIKATAPLISVQEKHNFRTHTIKFPDYLLNGLELGASVANNGCCLTVTKIHNELVSFDLMAETLRLTNLGLLKVGDSINLERAACFNDEIGGHLMSGHIICMAEITNIIVTENNYQMWFKLPKEWMKYVLYKGFIGIDGASLTICDIVDNTFCVNLIPETLERTMFGRRKIGDKVNIEIDPQTQTIVDTVERILKNQQTDNTSLQQCKLALAI